MATLSEARARLQLRRTDKAYSSASLNRFLDESRSDIVSRKDAWSWQIEPFHARTVARLTVASCSCTQGSAVVTFAGTVADTLQGKMILLNGRTYRVMETLTSGGTVFRLDQPFIDATASYTATVLYDEVALPPGATKALSIGIQNSGGAQPFPLTFVPGTEGRMQDYNSAGQPWTYTCLQCPSIPPPLSAPAAAMSGSGSGPGSGLVFYYWISYIDVQTRAESALSPASAAFTTTSGTSVTVTFAPRRGFHTRVYRSHNGTAQPYLLADVISSTTTTHDDTSTDVYVPRRGPAQGSSVLVKLYPVPDGAYQIVGTCAVQSVELDSDSSRPPWPEQWDAVWLDGAEARMLEASDEQGRAQTKRRDFEAGVARMIMADTPMKSARVSIGGHDRHLRGKPTMWFGALGSGGS